MMSARAALRTATAHQHDLVDAAFGSFDLTDADDYGRFLTAHARALPAAERALADYPGLPSFSGRTDLLHGDLAQLGLITPPPLPEPRIDDLAAAFGALYVLEGSRLGGAMLSRQIRADLPRAYLSAAHGPGAWRAFGATLDEAERRGGAGWIERAIGAALEMFDLYARSAALSLRGSTGAVSTTRSPG